MQVIKRGTTPTLQIKCKNIDMSVISRIDFIFKLSMSESKAAKIYKSYPDDITLDGDIFSIPLTETETRLLPDGSDIYWDVRPVTHDGKILNTGKPKAFKVTPTLFSWSDSG